MNERFTLLRSGELTLDVPSECMPLVESWIPLNAERTGRVYAARTVSLASLRTIRLAPPRTTDAILFLTTVSAYAEDDNIVLHGASASHGIIRPDTDAELSLDVEDPASAHDAYSMLTLSAAFLLGRMGHALMHAGAVVDSDGSAWLLVGDTHAGKTSTVVSLVNAGWSYLADDQVVMSRGESGEVMVEGWPRIAHLDEGYDTRSITGIRATVDLRTRYPSRLLRSAPLGGVLFPTVRAEEPTSTSPAHAAAAFGALVRQSPWLMADAKAAPAIASLLTSIAATRPYTLTLGADSYGRGEVIAACLDPASRAASSFRDS